MRLTIQVPVELAAQAKAQGVAPEALAERFVRAEVSKFSGQTSLESIRAAVDSLREMRRGVTLGDLSVKGLIAEGRKY